ncbi:MAG: hypothetical protein PW735_04105 [Acidobacteriaceae bacterium]|nr:hypothetical protein [Acidobacteriaceae bacterium]
MLTNHVPPFRARISTASTEARRVSHGGMAFTIPPHPRQPQDGSAAPVSEDTQKQRFPLSSSYANTPLAGEPEDAQLTGSTRSLFRRAMGLNVRIPDAADVTRRKPQQPAPGDATNARIA